MPMSRPSTTPRPRWPPPRRAGAPPARPARPGWRPRPTPPRRRRPSGWRRWRRRRPPRPGRPSSMRMARASRPRPRRRAGRPRARSAGQATARYMAPVSRRSSPRWSATAWARVDLPAPAGPSMATTVTAPEASGRRGHARGPLQARRGRRRRRGSWWPPPAHPAMRVAALPAARPATAAAMAMRWSPRASTAPGARRPTPGTQQVVAVDLGAGRRRPAPARPRPARRSDSLTRSSPTSRNTVSPGAQAAATASTGTSSRPVISAASTSVPRGARARGHDVGGGGQVLGPGDAAPPRCRPPCGRARRESRVGPAPT